MGKAAYFILDSDRELILPVIADLALTITPATQLYGSPISDANITVNETSLPNPGRRLITLDFNNGAGFYATDLGTTFQWPTGSGLILYAWQPTFIEQPEPIYGRATDWNDGGYPGAKYVQGVIVEANTSNVAKTFFIEDSDTLTLHPLLECPATFNGHTEIAFSCAPFVAHMTRLISSDGVKWEIFSERPVFQPWPELCLNWQTEMVSFGMIGWGHAREMNIAHLSTADLTLVLTFDAWPTITLTIPNSAGKQAKTKVTLPPNKWKLMGLQIFSTQVFRLFKEDLQLKIGQWGRTDSYNVIRPFGGESKMGAAV